KHQWRDCCGLEGPARIRQHVLALVEWSAMAGLIGLPTDAWVVREMLPVKPLLICMDYRYMPVVRERRYFVSGDTKKVLYSLPYWPEDALEKGKPSDPEWRNFLEQLHEPFGPEGDRLAETVASVI